MTEPVKSEKPTPNFIEEKIRNFEKKWLGANICYGCEGGCAISSRMMEEMSNDFRQALEEAIAEERKRIEEELKKLNEWGPPKIDVACDYGDHVDVYDVLSIINGK